MPNSTKPTTHSKKLAERFYHAFNNPRDCHYFAVIDNDAPVYPYGVTRTPYFTPDEAEAVRQQLSKANPKRRYSVIFGGFDADYLDQQPAPSEAHWHARHMARLAHLKGNTASPMQEGQS